MVMCRQPAMRAPASGFECPYFSRKAIRPGISFSANMISLRPQSASDMSATLYGNRVSTCATFSSFRGTRKIPALAKIFYDRLRRARVASGPRLWPIGCWAFSWPRHGTQGRFGFSNERMHEFRRFTARRLLDAAGGIHAPRVHLANRTSDIVRLETARQHQWHALQFRTLGRDCVPVG